MRNGKCKSALRTFIVLLVPAIAVTMSSCVNLDEITQFAKASQDVGKQFPVMTDQAVAACARANSFIDSAKNPLQPLPCDDNAKLYPLLANVNKALFGYIASLGALASDDLSKVAGGFSKLSDDLKQADPSISKDHQAQVSAAGSLATAITNLWANGYRERQLSRIVAQNNDHVAQVADFLSDYAAGKIRQSLQDEWRYEKSYCGAMASAAEPLATELLNKKCDSDKARIDLQLKAVGDYQSSLATLKNTHAKLNAENGHWDVKQLANDLGPATADLGNASVSMRAAF